MKTVTLCADWQPKPDFKLGSKDIDGKLTYLGSKVWKNPEIKIVEKDVPKIGPTEVLIKVKACGICGSDVHMAQPDDDGYIWYPGLTAFPATLGHEFSGIVVEAGEQAINKRTGKKFEECSGVLLADPVPTVILITVKNYRRLVLVVMVPSQNMLKLIPAIFGVWRN